jgi:hypothetical protein
MFDCRPDKSARRRVESERSPELPESHDTVELLFIINGEDFPVEANVNEPLIVPVERALVLSGNTGRRDP